MTSDRGELLLTRAVQECLNALQPATAFVYAGDNVPPGRQSGVFLTSKDTIESVSYWGEGDKRIRRRVVVDFRIEETELGER